MPGFAKEGLIPAAVSLVAAVVLLILGVTSAGLFLVLVSAAVLLFFRDPERVIGAGEGEILSPADGKVVAVDGAAGRLIEGPALRISVFMSVFNVHINRIPLDGTVVDVKHHSGGFRMAHLDQASVENERTEILMEDDRGRRSLMVQVAGLVARRIICRLSAGDRVKRGERFGLICFGSRVDVYLPPETEPAVAVGDKVRAGLSVIGTLR